MKNNCKMKILGSVLLGLFLVLAGSCNTTLYSHISIYNDSSNSAGAQIIHVYIVPHPDGFNGFWNGDLLSGPAEYILRGETAFFELEAGRYDVRVADPAASLEAIDVMVFEGQTSRLGYDEAGSLANY